MFTIALIEPKIPPNTGNVARLAAATQCRLDVVGEIGFTITEKSLRRAGLDYWEFVDFHRHEDLTSYLDSLDPKRIHLLTTKAEKPYFQADFQEGDVLLFGSETQGLPPQVLERWPERCLTIPMESPDVRSLNLSNSVSIVLYEALRQTRYKDL